MNANNRLAYSLAGLEKPRPGIRPVPVPARHGEPSVIKHVIYVIKENRTYDQVFGDMPEGNGDPNLVLYGEDVTPNHHKLAREFTLFDNFYCSGILSADGHQWVNEAYVTDYLEKAFGGFTRSYPYEGSDPLAFASSGFLWDNAALARKKTFRELRRVRQVERSPKAPTWTDMYEESQGRAVAELKRVTGQGRTSRPWTPYTHQAYPRVRHGDPGRLPGEGLLKELEELRAEGRFRSSSISSCPATPHGSTRPGMPTPSCDGRGQRPGARPGGRRPVSRSRFWAETCFFVVEDDPQNGFDHVDGHRTVALVISPYSKRKAVDSTCYNQTGMVKTIELLLGLPPMNQLDLSATAMRRCFQGQQDLTS